MSKKITKRTRQKIKMIAITLLNLVSFVTEIVIGYLTHSLALINDSFNMISALISLIIGLVCLWISTKDSKKNTYGWARIEIWAALVNCVCMIALCFTIILSAIQRLIEPEPIDRADLVLIIGGIGLGVNVIGVLTFLDETFECRKKKCNDEETEQGQSQTVHEGHSNPSFNAVENTNQSTDAGENDLSKDVNKIQIKEVLPAKKRRFSVKFQEFPENWTGFENEKPLDIVPPISSEIISNDSDRGVFSEDRFSNHTDSPKDTCLDIPEEEECTNQSEDELDDIMATVTHIVGGTVEEETIPQPDPKKKKAKQIKSGNQMNIQGVFLHLLGDSLSSVSVIVSGVVNRYCTGDWVSRVDPALSLVVAIVIVATTIPLIKQSTNILLQHVPKHVRVPALMTELKKEVRGIANVHDFHVWQLVGSRIIASLHIRCSNLPEYIVMSKKIKKFFHENGIHSTTIQPEFIEHQDKPTNRECFLECGPDLKCHEDTCCCTKKTKQKKISTASTVSGLSIQSALSTDTAISIDSDLGGTTLI